jgi:hypothetical protein
MEEEKSIEPEIKKPKTVLVIGDWLVDEHWVTGIHRSSTSSRTGQAHYRALHEMESAVRSFCGAGTVASLLYQVSADNETAFSIHGVGLWHKNDTTTLESMFEPENLKSATPFSLNKKPFPVQPQHVKLYNLASYLGLEDEKNICTTRIIRIYQSSQTDPVQFHRIDWELSPSHPRDEADGAHTWKHDLVEDLCKGGLPNDFDIVIIKDLGKGVVSEQLVSLFAEKYKKALWFVSTKQWFPKWLKVLANVNLRAFLVPQVAAQKGLRESNLSCWITRDGHIDELALNKMDDLIAKLGGPHKDAMYIALPEEFSAILYRPTTGVAEWDTIVQPESRPFRKPLMTLAMASVFLPALISLHLKNERSGLDDLLKNALHRTYEWARFESERISLPNTWNPSAKRFMEPKKDDYGSDFYVTFNKFKWASAKEMWRLAMTGNAVIYDSQGDKKSNQRLELWRSMTDVEGYVCCVKEKRQEIRRLVRGIEEFAHGSQRHHVGCMLVAEPGSGKTFLVRRLADELKMRYLPFNITQMYSSADILDCFDVIVTTQAQSKGSPIVVFVDEINATLAAEQVYDAFLSPLEDGVYIRGGKIFHIDPCFWIFSGTQNPKTDPTDKNANKSDKKSDFISRLSMGIIDLKKAGDASRLDVEYIYLGACLLLNEFPDIRTVSEKVLKAFAYMSPSIGIRDMKHFIKSFTDIQYGRVTTKNLRKDILFSFKDFKKQDWMNRPEGDDVAIRTQ